MQQTKAYWAFLAAAGLAGACAASACTVTTGTGDDDDVLGEAGEVGAAGTVSVAGSGGAAGETGGAGGGGTSGGGGAGPAFECDPTGDAGARGTGTPNTTQCAAAAGDDACTACLKSKCCVELSTCNATTPGNQCGLGGPNSLGEFTCYQGCLRADFATNGSIDESDRETCASMCSTSPDLMGALDCGPIVGTATNDLIGCAMDMMCNVACYGG